MIQNVSRDIKQLFLQMCSVPYYTSSIIGVHKESNLIYTYHLETSYFCHFLSTIVLAKCVDYFSTLTFISAFCNVLYVIIF